jgi:hypothetical protein
MNNLDQQKAGLQDDHDPRDPAQKQNDKSKGDCKPPNADPEKSKGELNEGRPHPDKQDTQQAGVPPDGDTQGGIGSQGGM